MDVPQLFLGKPLAEPSQSGNFAVCCEKSGMSKAEQQGEGEDAAGQPPAGLARAGEPAAAAPSEPPSGEHPPSAGQTSSSPGQHSDPVEPSPAAAAAAPPLEPPDAVSPPAPVPAPPPGRIPDAKPVLREQTPVEEGALSLTEHLQELRSRLFWSIISWAAASVVAYSFVPQLMDFARDHFLNKNVQLIFTHPTEAFIAYLKVAMVAGIFLASPILLYHLIMFVAPGLKPSEKRWVFRLVPVSIILFACGCTFAYFVVLPVTMQFFLSFSTAALNPMFQVGEFLSFITGLMLLCGASFQLPLLLFFASLAGLVSSKQLREGRRYAVFLSALIAAVATPTPDAFTMSVVALPIWILFEISVIVIRISGR
jgi:sec-independent protein translocase protein TatC